MNVGKHSFLLRREDGFTIVELLIVVVVIAILATITIVAYNGIKDRASSSAIQSATSQAGQKALSFAPLNSDQYPLEASYASDLSLPSATAQSTYDYYVSNDRKAFCLSVTDTTKKPELAYSFTQKGQLVQGRCVKNLISNPSFEPLGPLGWSVASQCSSPTIDTAIFYASSASYRCTANTASGIMYFSGPAMGVDQNQTYTVSAYVRSSQNRSVEVYISAKDSSLATEIARINSNYTAISTGNWGRVSASGTTQANTAGISIQVNFRTTPLGEQGWIDAVMYTAGPTVYNYADPTTDSNWSWASTPGTSASFGPTIPS